MDENRCISCGEIIPEGALTCYKCKHAVNHGIDNPTAEAQNFERAFKVTRSIMRDCTPNEIGQQNGDFNEI